MTTHSRHYWRRDQLRFREIVNTCTQRQAEKHIQRTAWILSHVLRETLCERVNGLCPAGWLNEQSITKHWFQSVRTCPYIWATGRITGNAKSFSALLATIRFLPSVCSHVRGQAAGIGKSFSTLLATKRFFSSVCSHVLGQVAGNGKSFSALLATKRFFSSVCSHVLGQVTGIREYFSAFLATIRFFSSVCSHVCGQAAGNGKSFSTL